MPDLTPRRGKRGRMGYYIYYSKACGEARIHYGDCPYCRHGYFGRDSSGKTESGEWLGPFKSYHDAETAAEKKEAEVSNCADCMP